MRGLTRWFIETNEHRMKTGWKQDEEDREKTERRQGTKGGMNNNKERDRAESSTQTVPRFSRSRFPPIISTRFPPIIETCRFWTDPVLNRENDYWNCTLQIVRIIPVSFPWSDLENGWSFDSHSSGNLASDTSRFVCGSCKAVREKEKKEVETETERVTFLI